MQALPPKEDQTPNNIIQKLQKRCDKAIKDCNKARAMLFDVLYPEYEGNEMEFKQSYIFFKEEMRQAIGQRDEYKERCHKLEAEIKRLRSLLAEAIRKEIA